MTEAAISIAGLTKSFRTGTITGMGDRVDALRGVDLEVPRGEIVGMLGPNGAGKTTLLEILATLIEPDAGRAVVCGHDVVADAAAVRSLVAYCPSSLHTFYPRLTGAQNLEFFASLYGVVGAESRDRIRHALDVVALADAGDAPLQTYSDGMQQRLTIARALVAGAAVLLMDEPTKSLDPSARTAVHAVFRRALMADVTMLLVTHSVEEAATVCDRVVLLERGRITRTGRPEAVLADFSRNAGERG